MIGENIMSRLEFAKDQRVKYNWDQPEQPFRTIVNVEAALDAPYFMDDGTWRQDADLVTYVESTPTWEEVETYIIGLVVDIRKRFVDNDESEMRFEVTASGTVHGDLIIKYKISDSRDGGDPVKGYSLRPTLDEFFRRKTWRSRNEPLALSYGGSDD